MTCDRNGDVGFWCFLQHSEGHLLGDFRADRTRMIKEIGWNAEICHLCCVAIDHHSAAMMLRDAGDFCQLAADEAASAAFGEDDFLSAAGEQSGDAARGGNR